MILDLIPYKFFRLVTVRPHKKKFIRVCDKNGQYLQTCNNMKDAKRAIDFNVKHGVWK